MYQSGSNQDPSKKRKHVRYKPDQMNTAKVQMAAETSSFQPELSALIYEEAYGGCCLVFVSPKTPNMRDRWRVQAGNLHPMMAEIVWIKKLDEALWKVGLKFLE